MQWLHNEPFNLLKGDSISGKNFAPCIVAFENIFCFYKITSNLLVGKFSRFSKVSILGINGIGNFLGNTTEEKSCDIAVMIATNTT